MCRPSEVNLVTLKTLRSSAVNHYAISDDISGQFWFEMCRASATDHYVILDDISV